MSTEITPTERLFVPGFGKLLTMKDVNGRAGVPRKIYKTARTLASDLGGDLSAAQAMMVTRVAMLEALCVHCEAGILTGRQNVPLNDYVNMIAAQTRLLRVLGVKRVPKDVTPSVAEYLAHKAKQVEVAP
jgi:hypothetical protein